MATKKEACVLIYSHDEECKNRGGHVVIAETQDLAIAMIKEIADWDSDYAIDSLRVWQKDVDVTTLAMLDAIETLIT